MPSFQRISYFKIRQWKIEPWVNFYSSAVRMILCLCVCMYSIYSSALGNISVLFIYFYICLTILLVPYTYAWEYLCNQRNVKSTALMLNIRLWSKWSWYHTAIVARNIYIAFLFTYILLFFSMFQLVSPKQFTCMLYGYVYMYIQFSEIHVW